MERTNTKPPPKSVEEAIGRIALSESFRHKAENHIKNILKNHIDLGSSEYKPIGEDAISDVTTNLFEKISKGDTQGEWYTNGVSSFGTANCALTRYMYRSVGNYARTRFDRWSDVKDGARVRDVVPVDVDETDGSVEDWLSRQVSELPYSDVESAAMRNEIEHILQKTKLPIDVINIVLLKCDNLTYDEIADTMGLTKDSIRMRLNRAKPDIAAVLSKL